MPLFATDNVTNLLQNFLDVQSQRTQVIAGNIANADTPNYNAKELRFEDFLRDAARQSELPFPDGQIICLLLRLQSKFPL
ncbi:MAG: hypothetical protein HC846_07300 [Blastocatellia bacterium]|nr:hypothetical protein [Blastocatellia bacterium]